MSRRFVSALSLLLSGFGALCCWSTAGLGGARNDEPDSTTVAAVKPAAKNWTVKGDDLLDEERARRTIRAERLNKEILRTIEAARKQFTQNPDASLGDVKRALTGVLGATDIDPDVRESLRARVQATFEDLLARRQKTENQRIQQVSRTAARQAQDLAVEQTVRREEQIEQLIDKVRSLMTEGFQGNGDAFERAEEVARAAVEVAPYSGVANAAVFDSEAAGQLDKAQRLRLLRNDKFLATLHQVELAHVPFPDEPPILYPAPEVWKALTERRAKWKSVDLTRYNPTEEKIRATLPKPTTVEFLDLPLEDCITFLKEYHNINILIDKPTLLEESVALDQPINLKLSGASFRSVLKLLLEPVQLTYVIEDEVMKITTSAKAADKLTTRVYPVGDLVIPITTPRIGGLGARLGGGGGAGGGLGGGGLGGGGIGGGGGLGGGGGGLGGGGGFFNIQDRSSAR